MKYLIYISTFLIFPFVNGQEASKSVMKEATVENEQVIFPAIKTPSQQYMGRKYYTSQKDIWKQKIELNQTDANAWFNYYQALRYENYTGISSISSQKAEELASVVSKMSKLIPTSFEYNLTNYINGNNNPALFSFLQKAYKLNSNHPEVLKQLVAYYEITGNSSKRNEHLNSLNSINRYAEGISNYNFNVIKSIEKNGVILTNGENDTYPLWLAQNKEKRPDITIVNLELMLDKNYQQNVFSKLGINSPYMANSSSVFNKILSGTNKQAYVGLSVNKTYLKSKVKDLYLVGLVFKFSKTKIENLKLLDELWNKKLNTSYLSKPVNNTASRQMNKNYLMPLITLRNYYKNTGNLVESKKKEALILKLAKEAGIEQTVKPQLK